MPPFRFSRVGAGSVAATLETCGANVFGPYLQIAQRAHKATATLATSLIRFIRMKETGRLVRKRYGGICILRDNLPRGDLQARLAERAILPTICG